jgi:hypothetical protein
LLCGLNPWHIRLLIDDPWNGGHGHSLEEVSGWTLDQVFMALADRKAMATRRKEFEPLAAISMGDKGGMIKGRAADGTPIAAKIGGKSLARRLMEAAAEREAKERVSATIKRGRRGRRGR